ncbi:MAG TPA: hypothetical protein VGC42_22685, partial [Kofleriaceae bacterium]
PLVKAGVVALLLLVPLRSAVQATLSRATSHWYTGTWQVKRFVRDGRELPATSDEPARWLRVRFQDHDHGVWLRWRTMDSRVLGPLYDATFDEAQQRLHLAVGPDGDDGHPHPAIDLRYTRRGPVHLQLDGNVDGAQISAELEWIDLDGLPLVSRGFHWISEEPFNW